jgi:hypothetical protein
MPNKVVYVTRILAPANRGIIMSSESRYRRVGALDRHHRRTLVSVIILWIVFLGGDSAERTISLDAAETPKPRAVIRGRAIELLPFSIAFEIPQGWFDWQAKYDDNIHLTAAALATVRVADSEWDTEYCRVANAVLPFRTCVVHAGGEGWGRDAVSYGDVQMRAYIPECGPQQIAQRMANDGRCEALRLSKNVSVARSVFENWQRVTVSYSLWYGDYGGTANVDLFARKCGTKTVAFVFMYSDSARDAPGELWQILKSFKWTP